jgi:hypothetical protein
LVYPQYHAKFYDEFDTVTKPKRDELPVSLWQTKCHFLKEDEINVRDHHITTVKISHPTPSDKIDAEPDNVERETATPPETEETIPPQEVERTVPALPLLRQARNQP